jgi:hypothetical protein
MHTIILQLRLASKDALLFAAISRCRCPRRLVLGGAKHIIDRVHVATTTRLMMISAP